MHEEYQYLNLISNILKYGEQREDRTGVGTFSLFGSQISFNLSDSFPLLTTKTVAFKSVVSELLWFIEGSDDERRLAEIHYGKSRSELVDKRTIWTANADNQGVQLAYQNTDYVKKLGPVYGVQWRSWDHVDQLSELIYQIKHNPSGRRHILTAWNVGQISKMALPPCHCFAQFYVSNDERLSCHLYQRSCDVFLGLPFNIASYALLTNMIATVVGLKVDKLIISFGDIHIYSNHIDQVRTQMQRTPYSFPMLEINQRQNINDFSIQDFKLIDYKSHPPISAPMAV